MNDEIELVIDKSGNKHYVLKNSILDLSDKTIEEGDDDLKKLNEKYYYNGKLLHREDGPAIEHASGHKEYWYNGLRHRLDGPAIEWLNGDKEWFENGLLNRENGPAVENNNGEKFWYKNELLNREDGPAIIWSNGQKDYYINGSKISEDNFYLEKELRESIINNKLNKKNKI